jgi:RNA methyltransferase, TrmH family
LNIHSQKTKPKSFKLLFINFDANLRISFFYMLTKNQIKFISALKLKKFREENGLFAAEGTKIVPEVLSSSFTVHSIYAKETWLKENNYLLKGKLKEDQVFIASDKDLERISHLSTPNEVLVLAHIPIKKLEIESLKDQLVIVLDEVKDPGNLGTIIRIADWFGIKYIICSENSVELYNPKVIQSTMGSLSRVEVFYHELKVFFDSYKTVVKQPVYGALLGGADIYQQKLSDKGAILMGNESKGISAALLPYIDETISIPSFGGAESLNVSVATAIICSEFRRSQ